MNRLIYGQTLIDRYKSDFDEFTRSSWQRLSNEAKSELPKNLQLKFWFYRNFDSRSKFLEEQFLSNPNLSEKIREPLYILRVAILAEFNLWREDYLDALKTATDTGLKYEIKSECVTFMARKVNESAGQIIRAVEKEKHEPKTVRYGLIGCVSPDDLQIALSLPDLPNQTQLRDAIISMVSRSEIEQKMNEAERIKTGIQDAMKKDPASVFNMCLGFPKFDSITYVIKELASAIRIRILADDLKWEHLVRWPDYLKTD